MMKQKPSGKRPTSHDVASLAGVSVTTVSFVVNNKSGGNVRISEDTRKKVWAAVEELNYRPSNAARSLRTRRTNMLALMIPQIEAPFHPRFAGAVQREAEKENLDVFIYSTRDELAREQEFIQVLISRGADGVITQSYQLSSDDINNLVDAGIAVVITGDSPTHPFADNVLFDEPKAAQEVVEYLISQGHQRIGIIAGPESTWGGRLRKQGYLAALQAHNLPIEAALIQEADFYHQEAAVPVMRKLLALSEPPTAIFCANDFLAANALLFAVDAGLSVPKDIAIVGFDNTREAIMSRPKLTTIHKDINMLASACLKLLVERINSNKPIPARQKLLDYEIIYRESA
jgi:DNA-binding LacI/PurR family transcriptional regulator